MASGFHDADRYQEDHDLSLSVDAALAVASGPPVTGAAATTSTSETLRDAVLTTLDEMKAEEIVQIDLRGKTSIGDTMIVCSGRSSRQVSSIADRIVDVSKFGSEAAA